MSITTVKGNIKKIELGITLPHEHIMTDLRNLVDKPKPEDNPLFYEKLQLHNRYAVYSDPYALLDNAVMNEYDIALKELKAYKAAGGNSIVDVTLNDIGRNPNMLKKISEESGVNIIMGCGYYIAASNKHLLLYKTEYEIADEIINDLTKGINGVKAGVIGEIGTSAVITPEEWKSLSGAGIAAVETGKAIHVHTSLWERNGIEVCKKLMNMGVKRNKIAINHIDVDLREDYILQLLDFGVYVEFDNFGKEFFIPKRKQGILKGRFAYDLERVRMIKKLIGKGYENQILITNDICLKSMLASYGGNGYGHILNNIVPMLKDCGISEKIVQKMLINNPADFLD